MFGRSDVQALPVLVAAGGHGATALVTVLRILVVILTIPVICTSSRFPIVSRVRAAAELRLSLIDYELARVLISDEPDH